MSRDLFDTFPARALSRSPQGTGPATLDELERARLIVAKIITRFPQRAGLCAGVQDLLDEAAPRRASRTTSSAACGGSSGQARA
jgi:hypothetical protein